MKNIFYTLCLLSLCSTAQSESFFGVSYNTFTDLPDGINVDGYAIEYAAVNDNIFWGLGYAIVDVTDDYGYGVRGDGASAGAAFGVSSFATGTIYGSAQLILAEGETDSAFSVGYAKRKIDELGYDISVSFMDGESSLVASVRIPVSGTGGIELQVADSDLSTLVGVGFSLGF